jgi:phenylalanyl-tRNA synthetase beta chain
VPIVNIELDWLSRLLGREFLPEEVSESLEQIGCDVEEVVEISRCRCPSCKALVESSMGASEVRTCPFCGHEGDGPFEVVDRLAVVRLDLLAARPDLFDIGGLARALRGTFDLVHGLPEYSVEPGSIEVSVAPELGEPGSYRPFIRCAVMTLPAVNDASLMSIMKLQESLHWGIGRDRKLASIGIYDLDTLNGNIQYGTLDPDGERFEPLGMPGQLMTGRQILSEHPKGKGYAHLLSGLVRYPVLKDSRGQVLSMPPIINSEATKLKIGTRRVFIDVTGISEAAVVKSLDTLVCSLLELGGRVESVRIMAPLGALTSPDLAPRQMDIDRVAAEAWLGIRFDEATLSHSLRRMRFDVEPLSSEGDRFRVSYPAFRTDIRHMVDVFEDLAIGFGYHKIEPRLVPTMTVGQARPEELSSAMARSILLGLGFSEVMSLPLNTEEDHFLRFREAVPDRYVRIANPKMKGLTVVRSHLLTGLLQSLHENRRRPLPLRLFEIDNVVELDAEAETGAREERRLVFVEMGRDAGYASVRAVLDALLREFGQRGTYSPHESPSFLAGRCATFTTESGISGRLGELHPEVVLAYGLDHPVTIAEARFAAVD